MLRFKIVTVIYIHVLETHFSVCSGGARDGGAA